MVATRITIRINWNALAKDRKQKNFQKFSNFQKIVQIQFFTLIAFVLSKNIFQLVILCRKQALKRKQDIQLSQNAPLICTENVPINSASLLLESFLDLFLDQSFLDLSVLIVNFLRLNYVVRLTELIFILFLYWRSWKLMWPEKTVSIVEARRPKNFVSLLKQHLSFSINIFILTL